MVYEYELEVEDVVGGYIARDLGEKIDVLLSSTCCVLRLNKADFTCSRDFTLRVSS